LAVSAYPLCALAVSAYPLCALAVSASLWAVGDVQL